MKKNIGVLTLFAVFAAASAMAQTTSQGTVNATLINKSGISIQFLTNASGVALTGSGSAAATAGFGDISAYGVLSSGVTRPAVTASNFTVRTIFDMNVTISGAASTSYNLTAALATAAPAGLNYAIDSVTLTTVAQAVQNGAAYATTIPHNLDLTVSTAAPTAGGPAVGTVVSRTINFTAVAN